MDFKSYLKGFSLLSSLLSKLGDSSAVRRSFGPSGLRHIMPSRESNRPSGMYIGSTRDNMKYNSVDVNVSLRWLWRRSDSQRYIPGSFEELVQSKGCGGDTGGVTCYCITEAHPYVDTVEANMNSDMKITTYH